MRVSVTITDPEMEAFLAPFDRSERAAVVKQGVRLYMAAMRNGGGMPTAAPTSQKAENPMPEKSPVVESAPTADDIFPSAPKAEEPTPEPPKALGPPETRPLNLPTEEPKRISEGESKGTSSIAGLSDLYGDLMA